MFGQWRCISIFYSEVIIAFVWICVTPFLCPKVGRYITKMLFHFKIHAVFDIIAGDTHMRMTQFSQVMQIAFMNEVYYTELMWQHKRMCWFERFFCKLKCVDMFFVSMLFSYFRYWYTCIGNCGLVIVAGICHPQIIWRHKYKLIFHYSDHNRWSYILTLTNASFSHGDHWCFLEFALNDIHLRTFVLTSIHRLLHAYVFLDGWTI